MSNYEYNARTQEINEDVTQKRRHSQHSYLHFKPTSVINHLKKKVKQKRVEKSSISKFSNGTSIQHTNVNTNNNNNNQTSQNHEESMTDSSTVPLRSRSFTSPSTFLTGQLSGDNTIDHLVKNRISIKKEQSISIVPDEITEDRNKSIEWTANHQSTDTDQKLNKLKPNLVKAAMSLPETSVKKRRQKVRRSGFKVRDEDFNAIFNDLPRDEQLIIAFPCAWRKDVFVQGRMFLSVNYFSFYKCFFKWEEILCIPYTDIISITREKSAKLVPNAIKIRTKNQEQYLFAIFMPREKVFIAIFHLWQNALLEQPLDYQQLRALIYADQQNHDGSSGDSEESISLDHPGEVSTETVPSTSLPVNLEHSIGISQQPKESHRQPIPSASDNEIITYLSSCTCETHPAKIYAERLLNCDVNTLFELICGDTTFTRDFHNAQKLTEYTYGEWSLNNETGKRDRQVTYKTVSQSVLGTNTLTCREKQTLEVERPNVMYVLGAEVYNEGVKYTDAFYVATRFCMVQRDSEHTSLRITAEVRYIKSINGFIKSFIEKSSNTYLEMGINEQVRRIEQQQQQQGAQMKRKSHKKSPLISKANVQQSIIDEVPEDQIEENLSFNSLPLNVSNISVNEKTITGKGVIYDIVVFIGIGLLLLHIYLCYKFYYIDQILSISDTICSNECRKTCLERNVHS